MGSKKKQRARTGRTTRRTPKRAERKATPKRAERKATPKRAERKATPKRAERKATPKRATGTGKLAADDIEVGRRLLKDLTSIVERANDQDAAAILGGGALEGLLRAVLPQKRRPSHSVYQYLIGHKRRASLMAQVRHAINESYSFPSPDGAGFVSPTRVQWFYDGLTFLYGNEPFGGVVGLFRNDELSWGLGVVDAEPGTSLGPAMSDFVTVDEARKSLKAAAAEPAIGIGEMLGLVVREEEAPDAVVEDYRRVLERHPWVLGAQHVSVVAHDYRDPNLPGVTAVRAKDGCRDVVVLESPSLPVVGKNGKVLSSFINAWHRAQRTLSFLQRQADFLDRELGLRFDQPRCFLIAGSGLTEAERETVRRERESLDAQVRVLTYDDLHRLAERTLGFFEARI